MTQIIKVFTPLKSSVLLQYIKNELFKFAQVRKIKDVTYVIALDTIVLSAINYVN